MIKIDLTKEAFFDSIRYAIYCHFFEHEPSDPKVIVRYSDFWNNEALEEHCGDCVNLSNPCIRCQADWIDEDAKKSAEALWMLHIKNIKEIDD
jgi:hypothetical protein